MKTPTIRLIGIALFMIFAQILPAQQPVLFISRTDGTIVQVDRIGATPPIVWSLSGLSGINNWNAVGMESDDLNQEVYLTGGNVGAVVKANSNGSAQGVLLNTANPTTFAGGSGPILGRRLDCATDLTGGNLFFTNGRDTTIYICNLDGSGTPTALFSGYQETNGIEYDPVNDQIFFIVLFDNQAHPAGVYRANADGSGTPSLLYTGRNFRQLTLDCPNNKIYWTDKQNNRILSGNFNGSGSATVLYNTLSDPYGIGLDPVTGALFWTENNGNVFLGDVSGSPFFPIYFGLGSIRGISIGTSFVALPTEVPTLSQWGLILLGLMVASVGSIVLFRKKYGQVLKG